MKRALPALRGSAAWAAITVLVWACAVHAQTYPERPIRVIVPMYAIIVRQYFSPREQASRLGVVLLATLLGMALGGWMSGALFDLTGSYRAAFVNGLIWNLLNASIALWLLMRAAGGPRMGEARLKHVRL